MDQLLQILTSEGFNKRFEEHLTRSITQREAYENTETEHEKLLGKRHYSSFKSFHQTRSKFIKGKF